MKKSLLTISVVSLLYTFTIFSMEKQPESKRRKIDYANISNRNDSQLEHTQIMIANNLNAAINSIFSFQDLKKLLNDINKIEQSNEQSQEIANFISQKYKHVLFRIFFNNYLIKNTESGIFSLSMSDNGKTILFGGESVLKINPENSAHLGLVCIDNLNDLLSSDDLISPFKIDLKENIISFLTAISVDSNFALNSNEDGCINLWKLCGLNDVKDIDGLAWLESINECFSAVGTLRRIKKFNLSNLEGKHHEFRGQIAVISADNKYALIADEGDDQSDALLIFTDLENETNKVFHFESDIHAITLIPNKPCALAGTANGSLILINFEDPENILLKSFELPVSNISSIAISSNGKYALIGSLDKNLILFNLNNFKNNQEDYIQLHSDENKKPISLCFSPDDKQALIVSKDGKISLMDPTSKINTKEKKFKMKSLNGNNPLILDQSVDCIYSIRSKFSSNEHYALIAYANNHGLNLACLGNLEPLSLDQIVLIAGLNSLKKKTNSENYNLIIKEILSDQECKKILNKFSKRELALLDKYFDIK